MENAKNKKQKKIRKDIEKICEIRKQTIKNIFKEYVLITIGCIVMAVGVSLFLLPNELSTGGFSGIATILYYLFKFPLGSTMLILNIPLLLVAYFKIGKQLFFRSIYGTIIFSVLVDFFDKMEPLTHDKFLGCIYGRNYDGNRNCDSIKV